MITTHEPDTGIRCTREQADRMVVQVVSDHADSLLRTARRYTQCHDDAQDAYQRALEILVKRAQTLDPDRVVGWIHTVVKHEALAVRTKCADLSLIDTDFDREEAIHDASPEERALDHERVAQTAEALQRLKPQELQALWHQALGKTYDQIAGELGWTRTKVNRCLVEGRRALVARFAGIESGEECSRWLPSISAMVDGEARADDLLQLRPHLRNCGSCRALVRELHGESRAVAALLPPVAIAAHEAPSIDAPGLLTRLHEAVATFVGERAALSAIKLQAAGDLVGGTKVAAVAASAAAMAGGGAVVADQVRQAPRTTADRAQVRQAPARPVKGLAPVAEALREARKVAPSRGSTASRPRSTKQTTARARVRREFGRGSTARSASARQASSEFTAASRKASSAQTSTASATQAPAVQQSRSFESGATVPPRRATQPSSSSPAQSGSEFGF